MNNASIQANNFINNKVIVIGLETGLSISGLITDIDIRKDPFFDGQVVSAHELGRFDDDGKWIPYQQITMTVESLTATNNGDPLDAFDKEQLQQLKLMIEKKIFEKY